MPRTELCTRMGMTYPIFSAGMGLRQARRWPPRYRMPAPVVFSARLRWRPRSCVRTSANCAASATAAAAAGVDAVIAQGVESGGHVRGTTSLSILLPAVVEAVGPIPVVAAGGIAKGSGLVSALGMGAQAVSIGTRFLASDEAHAAPDYKQRIVQARAEDTVLTSLFDGGFPDAPHRVLRNAAVDDWVRDGRPPSGQRSGEGDVLGSMTSGGVPVNVTRYSAYMPEPGVTADLGHMALYAGESCALVNDIKPAARIVHDLMQEAEEALQRLRQGPSSG